MATKAKPVDYTRIGLKPVASCADETCGWESWRGATPAGAQAKQHVRATGHPVVAEKIERTLYYLHDTPTPDAT